MQRSRNGGQHTLTNALTSRTTLESGNGKSSTRNISCLGWSPRAVGWSLKRTSGSRGTAVKPKNSALWSVMLMFLKRHRYEMLGNGCRLHKERSQADARDRDLADTGSHDIWNIDTPSCLSCDKSASSSDADLIK